MQYLSTGDVPGEVDNFAPDEGRACSGGEATRPLVVGSRSPIGVDNFAPDERCACCGGEATGPLVVGIRSPVEVDNFAPDEGCACSGGEATGPLVVGIWSPVDIYTYDTIKNRFDFRRRSAPNILFLVVSLRKPRGGGINAQ